MWFCGMIIHMSRVSEPRRRKKMKALTDISYSGASLTAP